MNVSFKANFLPRFGTQLTIRHADVYEGEDGQLAQKVFNNLFKSRIADIFLPDIHDDVVIEVDRFTGLSQRNNFVIRLLSPPNAEEQKQLAEMQLPPEKQRRASLIFSLEDLKTLAEIFRTSLHQSFETCDWDKRFTFANFIEQIKVQDEVLRHFRTEKSSDPNPWHSYTDEDDDEV